MAEKQEEFKTNLELMYESILPLLSIGDFADHQCSDLHPTIT